jgi:hypothetical protein
LDLFAGDLLTLLLTHPRPFADNLIITYIIQQTHLASRKDSSRDASAFEEIVLMGK